MNVRDTHGGNTHQFTARPEQAAHFRIVLRNSVLPAGPVRRVCEIGFNAGHSAALWLEGTQSQVEHVVSFDMLDHPYSAAMQQLLTALYGEKRISWHGGDSTKTVAAFAARVASGEEPPCDLWYIDGGHGPVVAADTVNALKSSYNGTIVLGRLHAQVEIAARGVQIAARRRHHPSQHRAADEDLHEGVGQRLLRGARQRVANAAS